MRRCTACAPLKRLDIAIAAPVGGDPAGEAAAGESAPALRQPAQEAGRRGDHAADIAAIRRPPLQGRAGAAAMAEQQAADGARQGGAAYAAAIAGRAERGFGRRGGMNGDEGLFGRHMRHDTGHYSRLHLPRSSQAGCLRNDQGCARFTTR